MALSMRFMSKRSSVLAVGFARGGPVGISTVAHTFGIGPVPHWFPKWFIVHLLEHPNPSHETRKNSHQPGDL